MINTKSLLRTLAIFISAMAVAAATGLTGSPLTLTAASSVSYSYVDLVGRLTNLEQLAQLPTAGETSAEWTSRDRSSTYDSGTGQYLNWGANNDGDAIIRTQPDGGAVLAEMSGPRSEEHTSELQSLRH